MNEKINIELRSFRFILEKNKSYIFPIIVIVASVLLFFQFVIPQFNLLLKTQAEVKDLRSKTEMLKENLSIVSIIDDDTLNSQYKTMISALPLSKDFIGILNSINATAQKAGVSLGSFSFKIGNLSSSENGDIFPVVKFTIPVNAGITGSNSFIQMISKTFPLAQVDSILVNNNSSIISLGFYYKLLNIASVSQYIRVSPVSQNGLELIGQMKEFEAASSFPISSVPIVNASASATQ